MFSGDSMNELAMKISHGKKRGVGGVEIHRGVNLPFAKPGEKGGHPSGARSRECEIGKIKRWDPGRTT